LPGSDSPHGCVQTFPNPKTRKPSVSIFYAWNTARKAAGLSDGRTHDLRHWTMK
jgi:hypothetical protein